MIYKTYKLRFLSGVHFGGQNLDESRETFHADTLFSALFIEALKRGRDEAHSLLEKARGGNLLLSDAFPYIGDIDYLPKPYMRVSGTETGDSSEKKAWKNLKYIPRDKMELFFSGRMRAGEEQETLKNLGEKMIKTSVSLTGGRDSEPYHVGVYYFKEGSGLYFMVAMEEEYAQDFYELMDALSFAGLGGKRSAGLGRFDIEKEERLSGEFFAGEGDEGIKMLLSTAFPREQELSGALESASYQMIKRAGFVQSDSYASEPGKKRPLYVFSPGSCFENYFSGDVYDVSGEGGHPVYRYAKALFWKLEKK